MKHTALSLAVLTLALAIPSSASLIVENSVLLGASSVVYDSSTGLYWIKPDLTLNQSYAAVQAEEGYGIYSGFSLATQAQVTQLFTDGSIPNITNTPSPSYYTADLAFINIFGDTGAESGMVNGVNFNETDLIANYLNSTGSLSQYPVQGFVTVITTSGPFNNCMNGTTCGEASIQQYFGSSTASTTQGYWLVASSLATPEPATFFLSGAGVLLLALRARSRARQAVR